MKKSNWKLAVFFTLTSILACEYKELDCDKLQKNERRQCLYEMMYEYIYANLEYPEDARENQIEGMVVIRFTIDIEGNMLNPKIVKGIGFGCDEEALRVVKSLQKEKERYFIQRKPTKTARGRPDKIYFNLPIRFEI